MSPTDISEKGLESMIRLFSSIIAIVYAIIVLWGCASKPPLIKAAYYGDVSRVRALLKEGSDVNMKGGLWNETALNAAARQGHFNIVKILLDNGTDIDTPPKYGGSALTWATWQCHRDVARQIVHAITEKPLPF